MLFSLAFVALLPALSCFEYHSHHAAEEDDVTCLLQLSPRTVPIDSIHARGEPTYSRPDLAPGDYTLSRTAQSLGITPENAKLSGGDAEWALFEEGHAPEELPGDAGPEVLQVNDPGDACSGGDIAGYSILNVSDPSLVTFILPKGHPGRRNAAIIIAPGGGDRFLAWTKEGTQIAKWLNSIGISAFVLKYRVPHNSPQTRMKAIIDAQRAISILRNRSADFGFESIGFIGFSAGGFLAAEIDGMEKRGYLPIDDADTNSFKPDFSLLVYASSSNPTYASPKTPPTFIVVARNDPCVDASLAEIYYTALMAAGGSGHELHVFADGHHGYGDCSVYVTGGSWLPVCAWTLNAQLFIETNLGVQRPLAPMTLAS